jgi:hypothetical protein
MIVNNAELDAIRERACKRKEMLGPRRARNLAAEVRLKGEDVQAYRCPFCPGWHLGHALSWEGVVQLAEALRFRAHPEGAHVDRKAC